MFEIIVRAIILDKKGNVLLTKRAKKPEKEKWALVGGKVEYKEKARDAVIRELKEELHIEFKPIFQFYRENFFSDLDLHCIIFYFAGNYKGEIKIKPDEILEIKFFSTKELIKEKNIAWDHKKVLLNYLEDKK